MLKGEKKLKDGKKTGFFRLFADIQGLIVVFDSVVEQLVEFF